MRIPSSNGAVRLKATEYTVSVGVFLVKLVPVLGTIVLIGAIFQVVLGFQVAADVQGLAIFTWALESSVSFLLWR